ncbi:hypothetical protein NQ315_003222 [Exocentrus adspersus]|uniref:Tyr recombinase domain-containing protein n=1 Tax=Exocentrus adspersus TaxID=1586481 RepID=A0AAV8VMS9_9CUCU|nr:hypothetical protein NQ315_003222 [Exocentrus adspersus]
MQEEVPEDIITEAEEAALQILPQKSRDCYEKELKNFTEWMDSRNTRKPKKSRSFIIIKEGLPVDPVDLCKKYIALRPKKNPEFYTGHCLRRSSATLLANAGANMTTLKRHGGWKSSTVAEGYLEDSIQNKMELQKKFKGPRNQYH